MQEQPRLLLPNKFEQLKTLYDTAAVHNTTDDMKAESVPRAGLTYAIRSDN
jgi:hypothetical protein